MVDNRNNPIPNRGGIGGKAGFGSTQFGQEQGFIATPDEALNLACNQHDICYQTCGSSQQVCDERLKNAMLEVCNNAYPTKDCPHVNSPLTCGEYLDERGSCLAWVEIFNWGLRNYGDIVFNERQEQYCYGNECCSE